MTKNFFPLSAILLATLVQPVHGLMAWTDLASRVARPTVAIRITWTDQKAQQHVSHGTGFLISSKGHYLTAAHIIPDDVDPESMLIEAELRPFQQQRIGPVVLKLVGKPVRSDVVDAAVLQDEKRTIDAPFLYYDPRLPRLQEELLIMGYSGESSAETNVDRVLGDGDNRSIKMGAFVQEGFSGSPVVNADGRVVGMVRGGEPVADIQSPRVMGKALFVPIRRIALNLRAIGVTWEEDPSLSASHTASIDGWSGASPLGGNNSSTHGPRVKQPIRQVRSLDVTQTDHAQLFSTTTKDYPPVVINASEGYRITAASFTPYSINGASRRIDIASDGRSATLYYALTSGPIVDQYRGWIKGDFIVTMKPESSWP